MAELGTAPTCCGAAEQELCCEPDDKGTCCPPAAPVCGCEAGTPQPDTA